MRFFLPLFFLLALFSAHFSRAVSKSEEIQFPPMNAPIEFMFNNGRPVFAILLGALSLVFLVFFRPLFKVASGAAGVLLGLNFAVSLKILMFGNVEFFMGACVAILLAYLGVVRPCYLFQLERNFCPSKRPYLATSLLIYSALVITANFYAVFAFPASATWGSRIHGVTSNPQHLGLTLGLLAPACLYFIWAPRFPLIRLLALAAFVLIIVLVFMTGSRMSMLGVICATAMFFRDYFLGKRMLVAVFSFLLLSILAAVTIGDFIVGSFVDTFIEGRVDSRSENWRSAFENFMDHPLFGVPPEEGTGRLIFVENAFLAILSTMGIVGMVFAIIIYGILVAYIVGVSRSRRAGLISDVDFRFLSSAGTAVIVVSLFEAALLGIVAAHTMMIYAYLAALAASQPSRLLIHRQARVA